MSEGMKKMKTRVFTSGIVMYKGRVLILKRSPTAPRFPNEWDNVGGHFKDENESAEECILREAKEECGLNVKIKKAGKVFEIFDEYGRAVVIPFLLESDSDKVVLSFEHTEYKWIEPEEIKSYVSVPDLIEDAKIFGFI